MRNLLYKILISLLAAIVMVWLGVMFILDEIWERVEKFFTQKNISKKDNAWTYSDEYGVHGQAFNYRKRKEEETK